MFVFGVCSNCNMAATLVVKCIADGVSPSVLTAQCLRSSRRLHLLHGTWFESGYNTLAQLPKQRVYPASVSLHDDSFDNGIHVINCACAHIMLCDMVYCGAVWLM